MNNFTEVVKELVNKLDNLPPRIETMKKCVVEKLLHSEEMYLNQIEEAREYLLSRDNLKVVKTIVKENKKKGV